MHFRARGDTIRITNVLENLGGVATEQKDFGAARAWFAEGLALARQIGYANMIAGVLHAWGEMNLLEGDDATARSRSRGGRGGVPHSGEQMFVGLCTS